MVVVVVYWSAHSLWRACQRRDLAYKIFGFFFINLRDGRGCGVDFWLIYLAMCICVWFAWQLYVCMYIPSSLPLYTSRIAAIKTVCGASEYYADAEYQVNATS